MKKTTLGLVVGNRNVFPIEVARQGREEILTKLKEAGIDVVAVTENDTSHGVISSWKDAAVCARLFRENNARIDGILVTLPNFGDERAVADSIKLSGLSVPVYIHAFPDKVDAFSLQCRRDSFCGKLSVCNNLRQYGIPYSIGREHVLSLDSARFKEELDWFSGVCRVVRGLKGARIGSLGARTTPFKTVRYSEKLLEQSGISVESKSLMETFSEVNALSDSDEMVQAKLKKLDGYLPAHQDVPSQSLLTTAKLGVVLDRWIQEYGINAYAIQCWSAMQDALKIFPCSIMSMMNDELLPSACEVDVMGAIAMYALQLAGGGVSSLFDWNNNYGEGTDKLVVFHCSNTAVSFMRTVKAGPNVMALKGNPASSCFCTLHGMLKPGAIGFARFSTDDVRGRVIGYIGEGEVTEDPLDSFGTTGVVRIPNLSQLMYFLTANGFEHHIAMNYAPRTAALYEALTKYMGWKIYQHNGEDKSLFEDW
ncbi:MAG: L-fucose/L-arabinose isomerase family protein [Thermoguttaceae bacterium]